jgi:hypothetical protein
MASLESKIYSVLSAATAVTAITTHIYPEHRPPADPLPAVVFSRVSGLRVNSLSGYSNLENASIQVECYSSIVDGRRALSDAVILAMATATPFSALLNDSPFDDYDDEAGVYIRTMDFSVWNRDT